MPTIFIFLNFSLNMLNNLEYLLNENDPQLLKKFEQSIKNHGYCIIKEFVNKKKALTKMEKLRSSFSAENDIRRSGKYLYKMSDIQRLDLGDFSQINARFSRMLTQFSWNKDTIFHEEVEKLIKFRNDYCRLERDDNFIYTVDDSKFCDVPKILHYPIGGGFMVKHLDYNNEYSVMNFILSLTKRGQDFSKGGVYYIKKNGEFFDAEEILDVGDLYAHSQSTYHGVHAVDPDKPIDLISLKGRCSINLSLEKF